MVLLKQLKVGPRRGGLCAAAPTARRQARGRRHGGVEFHLKRGRGGGGGPMAADRRGSRRRRRPATAPRASPTGRPPAARPERPRAASARRPRTTRPRSLSGGACRAGRPRAGRPPGLPSGLRGRETLGWTVAGAGEAGLGRCRQARRLARGGLATDGEATGREASAAAGGGHQSRIMPVGKAAALRWHPHAYGGAQSGPGSDVSHLFGTFDGGKSVFFQRGGSLKKCNSLSRTELTRHVQH